MRAAARPARHAAALRGDASRARAVAARRAAPSRLRRAAIAASSGRQVQQQLDEGPQAPPRAAMEPQRYCLVKNGQLAACDQASGPWLQAAPRGAPAIRARALPVWAAELGSDRRRRGRAHLGSPAAPHRPRPSPPARATRHRRRASGPARPRPGTHRPRSPNLPGPAGAYTTARTVGDGTLVLKLSSHVARLAQSATLMAQADAQVQLVVDRW